MSTVTTDITVSLDGFAAGPDQSAEHAFGTGAADQLHRWMFEEPQRHVDTLQRINDAAAYIMGRNMFGPDRGPYDLDWQGWWGPNPPYGAPVFVLGHHEREPLALEGGTTFYFVTDGIEAALESARAAAGDGRVAIAGGPATINQYLAAGLIDELAIHVAPILLGAGERLLTQTGAWSLEPIEPAAGTDLVTHLRYRVQR